MTNIYHVTRRDTLALGAGALAAAIATPATADEGPERHGISAFGDLKYPADFKQFDYVDPNAPKGGMFSQVGSNRVFNQNFLTFNSLNIFILKGDGAQGMELTFASLMARAEDEPDALYGLAARAVQRSSDALTYRFLLRPNIKFHDGSPLTSDLVRAKTRKPGTICLRSRPLLGEDSRLRRRSSRPIALDASR